MIFYLTERVVERLSGEFPFQNSPA